MLFLKASKNCPSNSNIQKQEGKKKTKYSEIEVMVGVCGSQGSQFWAHANALSACAFGSIVWNLM